MSTLTLMEKDGQGRMNVPADKVEAYKKEGWIVIDRPPEPAPVIQAEPIVPQMESPAGEEADSSPVDVEKAVEKISRRTKKG
jgi:hypothetical protein